MAKEILGHLKCPHCGEEATVHQNAGRTRAKYYRCYEGVGGGCGTVQISLPAGQKFINDNIRPLNTIELGQAVAVVTDDAGREQVKVAKKAEKQASPEQKPTFFSKFFEDE